MMSLLIHNVPPSLGDAGLKRLFGRFGTVVRVIFVFDHLTTQSCHAFIDMARMDDATRATARLNGRRIYNHRLNIECYTTN